MDCFSWLIFKRIQILFLSENKYSWNFSVFLKAIVISIIIKELLTICQISVTNNYKIFQRDWEIY